MRVSTTERRCFVLRKALFGSITSSNPFLRKNLRWALHRPAAEIIGFGAQVSEWEKSPEIKKVVGARSIVLSFAAPSLSAL